MRIYIELDSIIDTRLPILNYLNGDMDLLTYINRNNDDYPFIRERVFKKLYENRQRTLINKPIYTPMLNILRMLITEATHAANREEDNEKPIVHLNIYPYRLLDNEKDIILTGLSTATLGFADVDIIDIEPNIDILYNYDTIIKYDGMDLLDNPDVIQRLTEIPIPNTMLIVPKNIPPDIGVDNIDDMCEFINYTLSTLIEIALIEYAAFSILIPKKEKTDTD